MTGALAVAPPASAAYVDDVAAAWHDDPVYVDDSQRDVVSTSDERELESRIAQGDEPVFVAVLPESARGEAGGTTVGLLRELAQREGSRATYAAIVGDQFRAGSTDAIDASQLAAAAFSAHRSEGAPAVLGNFVDRVEQQRASGRASSNSGSRGGGGFGVGGLFVLGMFGLALFAIVRALRRARQAVTGSTSRARVDEAASIDGFSSPELAEVNAAARGDLVALGEALHTMDIEIELPATPPQAKQRYVSALDSYQKVSAAIDDADTLQALRPLSGEIARGRYALDCARALLDGKPEPAARVPCFFDPRHGTSVRDVQWASPDNEPLQVPACEICADRVESGKQPYVRRVEVHGQQIPYYEVPRMGGYYGGYFGGGGGFGGGSIITGMLSGNQLG
ncbi:MAG: hypothetical protein JWN41_1337, partial [Thermoleophilia bacterium]|nr:hypothetical protein [Thermoleophilia bacterium]